MKRMQRAAAAIGATAALASASAFAAAPANAYPHYWSCSNAYAASQCYDNAGQTYNPWRGVKIDVGDFTVPTVCAKGITAAGNIRSGSVCSFNTFQARACFSGPTPETLAYGYWNGGSGTRPVHGHAETSFCP